MANFGAGMPAVSPNWGGGRTGGGNNSGGSTGGSTGATPNDPGTRTWNDFKGRDPDLVYAGETVTVDGKSYTFKAGDTLADAAKALGMDTKALAEKLGMNMSLWGKNGNGDYFAAGPQPKPGDARANGPTSGKKFEAPAPAGPNGTYTKDQVATMNKDIQALVDTKKISPEEGKEAIALLNKQANEPEKFTAQDKTRLDALLKEFKEKSATGSTGSPGNTPINAGMTRQDAEDRLKELTAPNTGFKNSGLSAEDYGKLCDFLKTVANGGTLSSADAAKMQELDTKAKQHLLASAGATS
jgi:hypothetical protein